MPDLSLSLFDIRPENVHSLMPFWFWNDTLEETEILRQMGDFQDHGVDGFVLHSRIGLPRHQGWMSGELLHMMRIALIEARRRGMLVILYDDGMYPSGSVSGQVVAANPAHACRCLDRQPAESSLPDGANEVAVIPDHSGRLWRIMDRPVDACLRGLHYLDETSWNGEEDPPEEEPPAADILNPEAVNSFIQLVYQRYADEFQEFLGHTIIGIFTDEPGLLARCRESNVHPGTTGIIPEVNRLLRLDLTMHLNALWDHREPNAMVIQTQYLSAVRRRCEETYYQSLFHWCTKNGLELCGHPGKATDLGQQRWFGVPGQDLVWGWVLPGHASSLEGDESTGGKCGSSAAAHLGRRFNGNECFGAYGHGFTELQMKGLANWCFVRGVNRLYPHAFFYSIRGPRRDERPPDVGPNSPWWDQYKSFADACRWISWLLTDAVHVCHTAILGLSNQLPWRAAKVLFQNQLDFNYLEARHLWEDAVVEKAGIRLHNFHYQVLVIDAMSEIPSEVWPILSPLAKEGRLLTYGMDAPLNDAIQCDTPEALCQRILEQTNHTRFLDVPEPDLRVRQMQRNDCDFWLLTNEGYRELSFIPRLPSSTGYTWIDPWTMTTGCWEPGTPLTLAPVSSMVLQSKVSSNDFSCIQPI